MNTTKKSLSFLFLSAVFSIFSFTLFPLGADAATITAAQSGNWSSTATWTGAVVPGPSDDVQIVVDGAVTVTIDVNVSVNSIKLGAGSTYAKRDTLILDTGKTLVVAGTFQWDKVGVFQQNAGSSVTAATYMFGTNGSGYSMVAWTILGTSGSRASVHGAGSIIAGAPSVPPVQQVNWQYANFDISGNVVVPLKNAWDSNAYSSLNINHCLFNGTGYIDIGQYYVANSLLGSGTFSVTNNDFRDISAVASGVNANVYLRNGTATAGPFYGTRAFSGNVFSGEGAMGLVYVQTVGNNFEVSDNIFKNVGLNSAYTSGLANEYRSTKIYGNLFYDDPDVGVVNGLLVDYGGGLEIYDNLFMGQSPNVHIIMSGAPVGVPKTTIRNNVFDVYDPDADIIMANYVDLDILDNIFVGNGTPVNLGVSGGGGVGDLSPNSGVVYVKNNTVHLTSAASPSSVAGIVWAGETTQHTGGAVTFLNNIISDANDSVAIAYRDSQGTVDLFDYIDYNWFYNGNGGTFTRYYSGWSAVYGKQEAINMTGKVEGVTEGFGLYDHEGDPLFAHPERRMSTLDTYLGGDGVEENLVNKMRMKNGNVSGESPVSGYSVTEGLQYLREGFTPANGTLATAGQGGTYVGAVEVTSAPNEPTSLEVLSVTSGAANLRWIEPTVTGGGITSYQAQYRVGEGSWTNVVLTYSVSGGLTHYGTATVSGLSNGITYEFQVRAGNSIGYSGYSNSATGMPVGAPGVPVNVSAEAGNTEVSVSFSAPSSNGGSAISYYTVTSNPGSIKKYGVVSPLVVTGLTNDVSYTFSVVATNAIGTSTPSTSTDPVIPHVPVAVTFTLAGPSSGNAGTASSLFTVTPDNPYTGTITISFSGTGATGLSAVILTFSGSGAPQTFAITPTVAGVIVLTPTNNGSLLNPTELSYTANAVPPGVPTGVSAVEGDGRATISFSSPVFTGGSPILNYLITSNPGGISTTTTTTSGVVIGLSNGTPYTFTVKGVNISGAGDSSVASNEIIPVGGLTVPSAPIMGSAVASGNGTSLVTWSAPVLLGGSSLLSYTVVSSPGNISTTTTATTTTSAIVSGLVGGTSYTFTVFAHNITGTSTASTASNEVTAVTVPGAPTSFVGVPTTTGDVRLAISWSAPVLSGGSSVTDYRIQYKKTTEGVWGDFIDSVSSATSGVLSGLATSTSYDFRVYAINAIGESSPLSASVDTSPFGISSILAGSITGTSATISWSTDEDSDSMVYYGTTTSYGPQVVVNLTATKLHSVALSGLSGTTLYHYKVVSRNASDQTSTSLDQTFATTVEQTTVTTAVVVTTAPSSGSWGGSGAVPVQFAHTPVAISALSLPPSLPPVLNSPVYTRNLSLKSQGPDVKSLQDFLISKGFLSSGNNTGYFGNLTQSAVAKYQKSAGLLDQGYFGPLTRQSLSSFGTVNVQTVAKEISVSEMTLASTSLFLKSLNYGMKDGDVVALQTILSKDKSVYPEGDITGYFGKATLRAVKAFQKKYGIAKEGDPGFGNVGPSTRIKLNSL